jgi:hypothetical protein
MVLSPPGFQDRGLARFEHEHRIGLVVFPEKEFVHGDRYDRAQAEQKLRMSARMPPKMGMRCRSSIREVSCMAHSGEIVTDLPCLKFSILVSRPALESGPVVSLRGAPTLRNKRRAALRIAIALGASSVSNTQAILSWHNGM